MEPYLQQIFNVLTGQTPRTDKAQQITDILKTAKHYRWVGLFDVGETEVVNVAWTGPGAPASMRFPINQGLTSLVIITGKTIMVGDVSKDPRYLTAFGTTQSEIIIPLKDTKTGQVIGTLDIESDQLNAFSEDDQSALEQVAGLIEQYWNHHYPTSHTTSSIQLEVEN